MRKKQLREMKLKSKINELVSERQNSTPGLLTDSLPKLLIRALAASVGKKTKH